MNEYLMVVAYDSIEGLKVRNRTYSNCTKTEAIRNQRLGHPSETILNIIEL